jgi:capsular exopolysaccharide synthesis family protein
MSKFFNETIKAREAAAPVDDLGICEVQERRKVQIPSSSLLQQRFKGSGWLDSAEESYRALRTRLLRMRTSRELRSILLTSATQGEGKTMTSLNLAMCCAQMPELRVLLVDTDLRTGGLTKLVGCHGLPGLSEVLASQCDVEKVILATDHSNLFVLPAGSASNQPAELLAGHQWQELINHCEETFDLILVDAPPVLNLADVELLMPACDGALIIVRAGHVRRDVLEKSTKHFDSAKVLGLVYNGADRASYERYYYGGARN